MIICSCANINDRKIREILASGARTLADVQLACGASMQCGRCRESVVEEIARHHGNESGKSPYCPKDLAPTA